MIGPDTPPLPCPFCGKLPVFTRPVAEAAYWRVDCDECGIDFYERTREKLVALWNRRVESRSSSLPEGEADTGKPTDLAQARCALDIVWTHLHRLDPVLTHELYEETPDLAEAINLARSPSPTGDNQNG